MRLDRLAGLLAFLLASVTIVVGGFRSAETEPWTGPTTTLGPRDDPEVTARFLDLYEIAPTVTYRMTGAFVRERNGQTGLESSWREIQRPPDRLIAALGSVRGTHRGQTFECRLLKGEQVCSSQPVEDPALANARALDIVRKWTQPRDGPYELHQGVARIVAGQPTECFVLVLRPGYTLGSFGARSEYCYNDDAIPVYVSTERGGVTDVRVAQTVETTVTEADFAALLP